MIPLRIPKFEVPFVLEKGNNIVWYKQLSLLFQRALSIPLSGEGSPEGVIVAPVGTVYTRTDGTPGATLYVKETGTDSTGWVAK